MGCSAVELCMAVALICWICGHLFIEGAARVGHGEALWTDSRYLLSLDSTFGSMTR